MKLKRKVFTTLFILIIFSAGFGAAVLMYNFSPLYNSINATLSEKAQNELDIGQVEPLDAKVLTAAFDAAACFKNGDYETLSKMAHPAKGITFVPYSTVQADKNLVFKADEIKGFGSDTKKRIWGATHGSGEPINLTPLAYFEQYVYDQDFINAPVIGRNRVIGSSNSIENVSEAFPDGVFIEFHYPGFDARYGGLDWESLKLVFEKYESEYKLVAVIHSEWTI